MKPSDYDYWECCKPQEELGGKTDGCQKFFETFNGDCHCGCPYHYHRAVQKAILCYTKCQKIFDFKTQCSVDGCQEFTPSKQGKAAALTCAVCGCHRGFHMKELVNFPSASGT